LKIHEHHLGLTLEVALGNTHDIHCIVLHFAHVIQSATLDGSFLGCEIFDDRLDGNTHDIHCIVIHFAHVIQSAKVNGCFLGCEIFDDRLDDEELIDDVPV
jgi:hypothetical protein